MAEPCRDRKFNFDRQNQCERSDDLSLETCETDQQTCYDSRAASSTLREDLYPEHYAESTTKSTRGSTEDYRRLKASGAKNVTIPRYILVILVVAVVVTLLVCVTLLMIILLTKMPQNIADAAKEGKCGLSLLVLFPVPRGFPRVLRFPLSSKNQKKQTKNLT